MSKNETFLSLDHITVRYLDQILFENLSFHIKQGEHWALLGESGSGKSALLQTLAGKFNITKGKINYNFYDQYVEANKIDDPLFNRHKLTALVQQKHHFRNLSNTTEFYYQQRYNSFDSEDALTVRNYLQSITSDMVSNPVWSMDYTIERLYLKELLDKQLIKLSNGETRRLLIASALLKHPLLLLLDSPFTGLDKDSRPLLNGIITEITRSGITVVTAVSPAEIPDAVTNAAVLQEGKIEKTFSKEQFHPAMVSMGTASGPDIEELKALLNLKPFSSYEEIIRMNNVSVKYGGRQILKNISWTVKPGERWSLTGPNGAGKSTLLSLINGDNPQAYANDIILFDKKRGSGESIWDIKRKTGFVSPELLQYFKTGSSCLQVIESGCYETMGLFRKSDPEKAGIARRWMKLLGIEENGNQLFNKVSASTQRLCLLARALIKNPPLLILDEPFQGFEGRQKQYFKNVIDAVCRFSPIALIFVSHYQDDIPSSVTKHLKIHLGEAEV